MVRSGVVLFDMSREKTERNKLIVILKDEKGYTLEQIAEEFGLRAKSTISAIYNRVKKQAELSTGTGL